MDKFTKVLVGAAYLRVARISKGSKMGMRTRQNLEISVCLFLGAFCWLGARVNGVHAQNATNVSNTDGINATVSDYNASMYRNDNENKKSQIQGQVTGQGPVQGQNVSEAQSQNQTEVEGQVRQGQILGQGQGQVQGQIPGQGQGQVQCHFSILIFDGCRQRKDLEWNSSSNQTEKFQSVNLKVLEFRFKNEISNYTLGQDVPRSKRWNKTDKGLCEFQELVHFPPNCIELDRKFRFSDHISCELGNVLRFAAPALWIHQTRYKMNETGSSMTYSKDTTGLVMECLSPSQNILQLKTDNKIQFSGIGLKLKKLQKIEKGVIIENSDYQGHLENQYFDFNLLQMQIPKNFKTGMLLDYSGNYTVATRDASNKNKNKIKKLKNYEIIMTPAISTTTSNSGSRNAKQVVKILATPTWARCTASSGDQLYLAAITGENPVESRLLSKCLPRGIDCELKKVGMTDFKGLPRSTLRRDLNTWNLNGGVMFCSHPQDGNDTFEYYTDFKFKSNNITQLNTSNINTGSIIKLKLDDGKPTQKIFSNSKHCLPENNCQEPSIENTTFFAGQNVQFECHYQPYILVASVVWKIKFQSGNTSFTENYVTQEGNEHDETLEYTSSNPQRMLSSLDIKSAKFHINVTTEMEEISCSASYWDSLVFVNSSQKLHVSPSRIPVFSVASEGHSIKENIKMEVDAGQNFNLTCQADQSSPVPNYTWMLNGKKVMENENCMKVMTDTSGPMPRSTMVICNAGKSHNGLFTCQANNFLGNDELRYSVDVMERSSKAWIFFAVACGLIVCLIPGIICLYRSYLSQRAQLSDYEIALFVNGDKSLIKNNKLAHENAQHMPYNNDYEIDWKQFKTDGDELLGEGAFGIVMKGKLGAQLVAAKTVRPNSDKSDVLALLSELKIMIYLGDHENIIRLLGACTAMLKQGQPYVYVELCENGNMNSYLINRRANFIDQLKFRTLDIPVYGEGYGSEAFYKMHGFGDGHDHGQGTALPNPSKSLESGLDTESVFVDGFMDDAKIGQNLVGPIYEGQNVTTKQLLQWASDIAKGMEYLEMKKVIHGDLAGRNVLVTGSFQVKITDFGLSRQLQKNYTQYVKKQQAALPWRWMAIESLTDMVFTSKSDVWSYGVTLWEMFTLSEIPFPEQNWTFDFMNELKKALRPPKPQYANDQIYRILHDCWKIDPAQRPTFTQLKDVFAQLSDNIELGQGDSNGAPTGRGNVVYAQLLSIPDEDTNEDTKI